MTVFHAVLNNEEINEILSTLDPNKGMVDQSHYYSGSIGFYNLEITNKYLGRIENLVKHVMGHDIQFENSFTRIYTPGSKLGFHIDRLNLDVTVSLCLKRDRPWPLFVSKKHIDNMYSEENFLPYIVESSAYDLLPGDIVVCEGRKNPHWRELLVADPGQSNVYVFYHWRRV